MKTATKIKKAIGTKKNDLFLSLSFAEREEVLKQILFGLSKGPRRLSTLRNEINQQAGVFAETEITEKFLRGISTLYPKNIAINFTLGLDEVIIL